MKFRTGHTHLSVSLEDLVYVKKFNFYSVGHRELLKTLEHRGVR